MRAFVARLLNRGIARAWGQWLDSLGDRMKMQRFARRLLHAGLSHAWQQWLALLASLDAAKAVGFRLLHGQLLRVLNSWIEAAANTRRTTRTLRRLTRANLARAFTTWASGAEDAAAAATALSRALRGWSNGDAGRAFRRWAEVAAARAEQMGLMRRVLLRMANLHLARIFDAWRKASRGRKGARERRFRRAVGLMRAHLPARCFYAWQELLLAMGTDGAKMRRAVNYLRGRLCTQCFEAWQEVAEAALQRRRRAVARFVNALLSKTFAAWTAQVASLVHVKSAVRETINRMKNRGLLLCFRAWRDMCARKRDLVTSAAGRWRSAGLARAWDKWAGDAMAARAATRLARRVLLRYTNSLLLKTFGAWAADVRADGRRKAGMGQKMMAHMSGRVDMFAALCLQAWRAWSTEQVCL